MRFMRFRAKIVMSFFLSGLCSCQWSGRESWSGVNVDPDSVHGLIEKKMAEHSARSEGAKHWEHVEDNEYQRENDLEAATTELQEKRDRRTIVKEFVESGPLLLTDCLALCLEFNDLIQAARAELRAVGGDSIVVRSRFVPQLNYVLQHAFLEEGEDLRPFGARRFGLDEAIKTGALIGVGNTSPDLRAREARRTRTQHIFRWSQTLLEFGRDNSIDVALRESQRSALFDYEDVARDVLSDVRRVFFTIRLRERQLDSRRKLLAEFEADLETISRREDTRLVPKANVLTAQLNVLDERLRVNSLEKEIVRRQIELLRLIGMPAGVSSVELAGEVEEFTFDIDRCVGLGLRRSTEIAEARALVFEQARVAQQIWWENAPGLRLRGGWMDEHNTAGLEVDHEEGVYSVSGFGENQLERRDGGLLTGSGLHDFDERGWFVDMELDIPFFDGLQQRGKVMREKARLERTQHELRDTVDGIEQEIRQSYQTVLEQRVQLEIQRETVEIAKARLETQQELRELGRISEDELETFRNQFFTAQDDYFSQQITLIEAQEQLRSSMRYFAPQLEKEVEIDVEVPVEEKSPE